MVRDVVYPDGDDRASTRPSPTARRASCSTSRSCNELGWAPKIGLDARHPKRPTSGSSVSTPRRELRGIDRDVQRLTRCRSRAHHRHHRPGRLVPRRAAARRATRSTASSAARRSINTHRLDHLYQDPTRADVTLYLHYGDLDDRLEPRPDSLARSSPTRSTTSRRRATCRCQLRDARVHRPTSPARHGAPARGDPRSPAVPSRFYQASSSEMFGASPPPQNEDDAVPSAQSVRAWPRCTPTGRRSTTARRTACSRSTGSCSTTRARAAARRSSPARSPRGVARIEHGQAGARCISATSTPARLGLRRRLRRGDVAHAAARRARRLRGRHRRDAHGARVLRGRVRPRRARLGTARASSTRATTGPPKSSTCSATPSKADASSAGSRRSNFRELVAMMVDADVSAS